MSVLRILQRMGATNLPESVLDAVQKTRHDRAALEAHSKFLEAMSADLKESLNEILIDSKSHGYPFAEAGRIDALWKVPQSETGLGLAAAIEQLVRAEVDRRLQEVDMGERRGLG